MRINHQRLPNNAYLTVCRKIADSTLYLCLITAALFLVFGLHSYITSPLAAYEDGTNLPDGRITGYTPKELNLWYDSIGVEGCKVYIKGANWDFFPIMLVYPLFLGSMLVKVIQTTQLSENLVYLPLVTVVFDMVETYLQAQGCMVYPERLADERIAMAANACRIKWALLIASLLLIFGLFIREKMAVKASESDKKE